MDPEPLLLEPPEVEPLPELPLFISVPVEPVELPLVPPVELPELEPEPPLLMPVEPESEPVVDEVPLWPVVLPLILEDDPLVPDELVVPEVPDAPVPRSLLVQAVPTNASVAKMARICARLFFIKTSSQ